MNIDKFTELRQKESPAKSLRWYQDQIRRLGMSTTSASQVLSSGIGLQMVRKPIPGDMVLYLYDPATKDSLPYYDTAPLVFPFRSAKGGFYGVSLHYMPALMRVEFVKKMMNFSTTPGLSETTRLRLKWEYLNTAANSPEIPFAVKRYLYKQMRSQAMVINPLDWVKVALLPIESFVKASKNKVYADLRRS